MRPDDLRDWRFGFHCYLHGPIIQPEPRDTPEIAAIAGKEDEIVCQGNGGNLEILGPDPPTNYKEVLKVILARLVEWHD